MHILNGKEAHGSDQGTPLGFHYWQLTARPRAQCTSKAPPVFNLSPPIDRQQYSSLSLSFIYHRIARRRSSGLFWSSWRNLESVEQHAGRYELISYSWNYLWHDMNPTQAGIDVQPRMRTSMMYVAYVACKGAVSMHVHYPGRPGSKALKKVICNASTLCTGE